MVNREESFLARARVCVREHENDLHATVQVFSSGHSAHGTNERTNESVAEREKTIIAKTAFINNG